MIVVRQLHSEALHSAFHPNILVDLFRQMKEPKLRNLIRWLA